MLNATETSSRNTPKDLDFGSMDSPKYNPEDSPKYNPEDSPKYSPGDSPRDSQACPAVIKSGQVDPQSLKLAQMYFNKMKDAAQKCTTRAQLSRHYLDTRRIWMSQEIFYDEEQHRHFSNVLFAMSKGLKVCRVHKGRNILWPKAGWTEQRGQRDHQERHYQDRRHHGYPNQRRYQEHRGYSPRHYGRYEPRGPYHRMPIHYSRRYEQRGPYHRMPIHHNNQHYERVFIPRHKERRRQDSPRRERRRRDSPRDMRDDPLI